MVDGYVYFGVNRVGHESKTFRSSGGVGMLIKKRMYELYKVEPCFKAGDNILGVKFYNDSGNSLVIYCVYLPPEGSKYSIGNEQLLNSLTVEIYRQNEVDNMIICGDFNTRIGNKQDTPQWDDFPKRKVLDETMNSYGQRLITFVNDIKGCILNGRVTPEYNYYTSVATDKGMAVVDYFITRQSDVKSIVKLKVKSPTQVIESEKMEELISDRSQPPDHSLLTLTLEMTLGLVEGVCGNTLGAKAVNRARIL